MYYEKTTFIILMNNNKLKITLHYMIFFELIFMYLLTNK